MKQFLYWTGRFFQLLGLLFLPSAFWMTEVVKSEAGALLIFFGAIVIFFFGWVLTAEEAPGSARGSGAVPARGYRPRAGGGDAKRSRPLTQNR